MPKLYFNIEQIRNAVDIVIGDDGFRCKEVIEILQKLYLNWKLDTGF